MSVRNCLVALLANAALVASAATYHVAQTPAASDDNPGTADHPWLTLSKAAATLVAGDTAVIHAGIYREQVRPAHSGTRRDPITYQAAKGDAVVITGANLITGWTPHKDAIWKKQPWTYRFETHPNDARHRLIGRCEQVIADGRLLRQVEKPDEMKAGTFCADTAAKVLYVWLPDGSDPNQHAMEASVRGVGFGLGWAPRAGERSGEPRHAIHLQGLTIRHAANMAQRGALFITGDDWLVEDCTVEWTNGNGISFRGDRDVFRRVRSHHNGQMGLGGGGRDFVLDRVGLDHNNLKGYSKGWEAGGMKIALARGGTVRLCEATANDGVGLWFDIDVRDITVEQCLCRDNTGTGIFVEISGGFQIRNNLCVHNGTDDEWGQGGIGIAESDHCTIEHNTCVLNPTGISIREQGPRTFKSFDGTQVTYHVHDITITRNVMALNTKYQFGLWSDNTFFGPHPSPQVGSRGTPYDPDQCNIRLDYNLYGRDDRAKVALWGVPWREKHQAYDSLAMWQARRDQDVHSVFGVPRFVYPKADNWRLMPLSPGTEIQAGPLKPPAGTDAMSHTP